jgi:hypothetical protein
MLARLICFLLGHSFNEVETRETPHPDVFVIRGKCARCGKLTLQVHDFRQPEWPE